MNNWDYSKPVDWDALEAFDSLTHALKHIKSTRGTGNVWDAIARNRAIGILNQARLDVLNALPPIPTRDDL